MAHINQKVVHNTSKGKVALYQKSGQVINGKEYQSKNWYASIRLPKNSRTGSKLPLQRFSTKRADFDAAVEFAMGEFWEISERHKRDLPVTRSKFSVVAKKFVDVLGKEGRFLSVDQEVGYYSELSVQYKIQQVEVFLLPFFGELHLEDITDQDIRDFKRERSETVGGLVEKDRVKPASVNRTLTVLRQIYAYAVDRGLMDSSKVLVITNMPPSKKDLPRNPDFTPKEYKSLISTAMWMVKKANHPRVEKQRFLLYHLMLILAKTGARMTEMNNLKWSDIVIYSQKVPVIPVGGKEEDTYLKNVEFIKIRFYGKVSRSTQAKWSSPVQNVRQYFERLKAEQQKWAKEYGWKWGEDVKVLTNHKGEFVGSFTRGFDAVLKKCGLTYAQVGVDENQQPIVKKRNLGGLRHLFALRALRAGWDSYMLAKNMRTSPDMINRYYANEIEVEDIPLQVIQRRQQRNPILDKGLG